MSKELWRDNFKSSSLRIGFKLGLSRAMCEYLSAVADGVAWNRSSLGAASPDPDNFIATGRSLVKRGLIEDRPGFKEDLARHGQTSYDLWNWTRFRLTPAGTCVVELLKLADLFVEADVAMEKKARAGR